LDAKRCVLDPMFISHFSLRIPLPIRGFIFFTLNLRLPVYKHKYEFLFLKVGNQYHISLQSALPFSHFWIRAWWGTELGQVRGTLSWLTITVLTIDEESVTSQRGAEFKRWFLPLWKSYKECM